MKGRKMKKNSIEKGMKKKGKEDEMIGEKAKKRSDVKK